MEILIKNFITCILWGVIIYSIPIKRDIKDRIFLSITFIQLVLVHSLVDYKSLPDLPNYYDAFNRYAKVSFDEIFHVNKVSHNFEPGYVVYCKLISYVSTNFNVLLTITSVIMFFCYYKTIERYSAYPFISVLLIIVTTYNQSFFVLRQHLAMSILLLTYPYIINKQIWKYLILCAIAFSIHYSAIVFIPLYFLYNIEDKRKYMISIIIVSVILIFTAFSIFVYFGDLLGYSGYIDSKKYEGANYTNFFIMLILLGAYIFSLKREVFNQNIQKLIFSIIIIAVVGSLVGVGISGTGRLFYYYTMIPFLLIPNVSRKLSTPSKEIIIITVISLYAYMCFTSKYFDNLEYII